MKANKKIKKKGANKTPTERNKGPVKSVEAKGGNRLPVKTGKLHPVHAGAEETLYVPEPVSPSAALNDGKQIPAREEQASPDVLKSADTFVRTLVENDEIEGVGNETKPNPTHKIEVNEQGQKVVKRRGFRAF